MISHQHRCIFVHIPKCGGQSTETLFLRDLGLTWEQRAPLLMRPAVAGELGPPMLAHLLARDYVGLRHVSQELFDAYLKFTVVRDPLARAESTYRYLKLDVLMGFDRFAQEYLPAAATQPDHLMHWFLRPQVDFLHDDDGALLVDRVILLEDLDAEMPELARSLGVADTVVPRVNVSQEKSLRDQARTVYHAVKDWGIRPSVLGRQQVRWTDDNRAAVAEAYAADLAMLERLAP